MANTRGQEGSQVTPDSLTAFCAKALLIKYFRLSYDVGPALNKQTRTTALHGGKIRLEGTCGDAEWTRHKKGFI